MIRRTWIALVSFLLLGATAFAQQPASPDGFVPISSLPPGEELPAAPLPRRRRTRSSCC